MKKVLTVKDIAEILGICDKTAYGLVQQALITKNTFRVIKIGSRYKIPTKPFLDWLDASDECI